MSRLSALLFSGVPCCVCALERYHFETFRNKNVFISLTRSFFSYATLSTTAHTLQVKNDLNFFIWI